MHKKQKTLENPNKLIWTDLYDAQYKKISDRVKELKTILQKWDAQFNFSQQEIPQSEYETILLILRHQAQYSSIDRYSKAKENKIIHDQMIKRLQSVQDALMNFKIFGDQHWDLVIDKEIVQKIIENVKSQEKLKRILARISLYLNGYISITNHFLTLPNKLNELGQFKNGISRYYKQNVNQDILFLTIGIEKIPKVQYNKNKVNQMIYSPFIQILAIFHEQPGKKQLDEQIHKLLQLYKVSPSKNLSQQTLEEDKQAMQKLGKRIQFFKYEKINPQDGDHQIKRSPIIYKPKKCQTQEQYNQYLFSLQTFKQSKKNLQLKLQNKKQQSQQSKLNKLLEQQRLRKHFSFSSSKNLLNVYNKIPNKKYHLTTDQKQIVAFDGNVIVIGRSGTGKTLCALLRLFIIQLFYKQRQFKKLNLIQRSFQAKDIDKILGLKNLFITASPYLIKQIKKQYDQMVDHIKALLMEHKAKRTQKNNKEGQQLQDQQNLEYNKQLFDYDDENFDLDMMIQNFEQKLQRMKSLNDLNQKDYPGFFSIKKFIKLLDGTLKNPMFYKKYTQQDQENQTNQNNNNQISEKQLMKEQKMQQFQQQDENYDQGGNIGWIQDKRQLHQLDNLQEKQEQKVQVDYDTFTKQFWPLVPKQYFKLQKQLQPANVWSQIYSIIKGSYESHKSHTKYLSKIQYIKSSKHDIEQEIQYKKVIYTIFQYYENWKQQTNHYDFMDLVNHILSDIDIYGYQGPMLNYLFVDQVQDLPPATLYLVSKIVTNGLFYCGDSAQTIAKGVNFHFSDIQKIFSHKFKLQPLSLPNPQKIQLTVNFRSHNQILQLGHSVITMIQKLFPGSIDSLKKQYSNYRGPIPLILHKNEQKLLQLLTNEVTDFKNYDLSQVEKYFKNSSDRKYYKLGPEQIILVRNTAQKERLPFRLKQGVVLTFQDVKGLQYDDVVLVNFFSSSRCKDKWKLLKYLDVIYELIQQNQYQQSIKCKQKIQGHHLDGDANIQKHFDWNFKPQKIIKNNKTYYKVPAIDYCKDINQQNIKSFYELLMELKVLYTAITRARKAFIIYEETIPKQLQNLWIKMKAIRHIKNQNQKIIRQEIHQYRTIHRNHSAPNQQKAWAKQGYKWYVRKNYQQAIRCFINGNDMKTAKRIEAEMKANQAGFQLKRLLYQLKNPQNLSKQQFKIQKKLLSNKRVFIGQQFNQVGKLFQDIGQMKKAGSCYFQAVNYQKALQCFEKINFVRGCAECCQLLGYHLKASKYFQKMKNYVKMLECLEKSNQLTLLYQKLFQYLDQIVQSAAVCKKYGLILFRKLVNNYIKSNQYFNTQWANKIQVKFSFECKQMIQNNIKRYILYQCAQNAQKILLTKIKVENINQKLQSMCLKQKNEIKQQLKQIEKSFTQQYPFKPIQIAKKFFYLKQDEIKLERPKPFAEHCNTTKIPYKIAQDLVQKYSKIHQVYSELQFRILQINNKSDQFKKQKSALLGRFKDQRHLINTLDKLQKIFNKNLFPGYNKEQQIIIRKISNQKIEQIKSIKQKNTQANYKQIKLLEYEYDLDDDLFETSSFLDQPFDSNYQSQNQQSIKSWSNCKQKQSVFKGVIFNFSISKQKIEKLINQTKNILIIKMGDHIDNPLKSPFSNQHHLQLQGKIQTAYKKVSQQEFRDILKFLRKVQFIGQDYLSLLICQYYHLYDLAKKFIISKLVRFNKIYQKKKILTLVPYLSKNNNENKEIKIFINQININYLKSQSFRTLSTKQRIIDGVIQSLLLQGMYRNTTDYLIDTDPLLTKIGQLFMDYSILKRIFSAQNKISLKNYDFLIVSQKKFGLLGKIMNAASMQQVFYLYDSINQKPFFSDINWKQGVELSSYDTNQIANQIERRIKKVQQQIQNLQKLKKQQNTYLNKQLIQIHYQKTKNKQTHLQNLNLKIQKKKSEIRQGEQKIKLHFSSKTDLENQINYNQQTIKHLNKQRQKSQSNIQILKKINFILKLQQKSMLVYYPTFFYQFNQYQKAYNQYLNHSAISLIDPVFDIKYNTNNDIQNNLQNIKFIKQNISQSTSNILQLRNKIFNIERQIQNIRNIQIQSKLTQIQDLRFEVNYYINLNQEQKLQIQRIEKDIDQKNKQIKQLKKYEKQQHKIQRKKLFQQYQQKYIDKIKLKHKFKIIKKAKKIIDKQIIPYQYDRSYFKAFIEIRKDNVLKKSQSYDFKKCFRQIIENYKVFNKLDTFHQCEIIIFYLSIVCYQQKQIFQYLNGQVYNQLNNQRERIRELLNQKKYQKRLLQQQIHRQGGYMTIKQGRYLKEIDRQLSKLQYEFKNPSMNTTTSNQIRLVLMDINERYHRINSQQDLKFVQQMLGFFQCRVIRNFQPLQFFQLEYVIVKSSSVLVKQTINYKNKIQDQKKNYGKYNKYSKNNPTQKQIFCFYFDQNKQYVIMKFQNAWRIMTTILRAKHGQFLKRMKFWQQFQKTKQKGFLSYLQVSKVDGQSLQIHKLCNINSIQSIEDNYRSFVRSKLLGNISRHKQKLLYFYYSNGFKSPQTFHFYHHQLKVMHQMSKIIQKNGTFSNLMINDLQNKLSNLEVQFERWKDYLQKNNQINQQSCEDQQENNQNENNLDENEEIQIQDV